jgi:hypothetical protein
MSRQRAVIFDLETVSDLTAGRELLTADADVSDETVRRLLGERCAKPGEDPDNRLSRSLCRGLIVSVRYLRNGRTGDHGSLLPSLESRHAVLFGKASSCENPVLLRLNDRDAFVAVFRAQNPPDPLPPAA